MSHRNPDPLGPCTSDLLRSLHHSILRLRQEAEDLRQLLAAEGEQALAVPLPRIAKLEGLIRDCQKVEKTLVEQTAGETQDQSGVDLAAAQLEISRRLDRLRTAYAAGCADTGAE